MNVLGQFAKTTVGRVVIVFVAGAIAGAVYWALRVTSPAPPPVSLVGLLGILIGEAVVTRIIGRIHRRARAASARWSDQDDVVGRDDGL